MLRVDDDLRFSERLFFDREEQSPKTAVYKQLGALFKLQEQSAVLVVSLSSVAEASLESCATAKNVKAQRFETQLHKLLKRVVRQLFLKT